MNQLTHVEAGRMLAVIDEAIDKIKLQAYIQPGCQKLLDRNVSAHAIECLEQLFIAEGKYEKYRLNESFELSERRIGQDKNVNDPSSMILREWVRRTYRAIRDDAFAESLLLSADVENYTLIEEAKDNTPEGKTRDAERTDSVAAEPNQECMKKLIETLQRLRQITNTSLSTTIEQANSRNALNEEIKVRTKTLIEDRNALRNALEELNETKRREKAAQNEIIDKLKGELKELKLTAENESKNLHTEVSLLEKQHEEAFHKTMEGGVGIKNKLKSDYEKEFEENVSRFEVLRKKKVKANNEVNGYIKDYDANMLERYAKYSELKALHEAECMELMALEEYFRKVDCDLANEAEEERIIAEEQAKIDAYNARINRAITTIQANFRGLLERRRLAKKKRRKKGKGKGKKKKK